MADHLQDSLIREIDDDLRQERYAKLWKQYGNYIFGAAAALVLGVGAYQGWHSYDQSTRMADGEAFAEAAQLAADNNPVDAAQAFSRLTTEAGDGYALLARFREAALVAERDDAASAIAIYREIADDSGFDAIYRDLAVILASLQELNGAGTGEMTTRLAPLMADDNPWRHSAWEITAIRAHRDGDTAKAREMFTALAGNAAAPRGIRARAEEMLDALGR